MWHLLFKNKQIVHNYVIFKFKCTTKKTTGQWRNKIVAEESELKFETKIIQYSNNN